MDILDELFELSVVVAVAALAPVISALIPKVRVPQVVILIFGGIAIGEAGLDLDKSSAIQLIAYVGLGFVFLLAGFEVEPEKLLAQPGRLALVSWLISAVLATATVGALAAAGFVHAFVPVALALTTTALGTVLPILREHDLTERRHGEVLRRGRGHRRALPDPGDRDLPGRRQPADRADLHPRDQPDRGGARRVPPPPGGRAAACHRQQGRRLHRADHPALLHPAAARPAGAGRRVRARRGPRRVPGRRGVASLGAGRHALPGGQARRRRLRVLHPGVLRRRPG